MTRREFRIAETGETIRDETAADDAFVWGYDVHYREYGPHDETPGPWRVYGTEELVDAGGD